MIAVIATFTLADGQAEAFEKVARDLIAQVRANEPGVLLYTLVRARKQPNIFKMIERYQSKEDIRLHGETAYFREAFAAMKPLLAAEPLIEMLEEVA